MSPTSYIVDSQPASHHILNTVPLTPCSCLAPLPLRHPIASCELAGGRTSTSQRTFFFFIQLYSLSSTTHSVPPAPPLHAELANSPEHLWFPVMRVAGKTWFRVGDEGWGWGLQFGIWGVVRGWVRS